MKSCGLLIGAFAHLASAHYFFEAVVDNGVTGPPWQYIREFSRAEMYNPIKFSSNPAEDIRDNSYIDGADAICNQNGFAAAGNTEVLSVAAGSDVTVKLGVGASMQHPGPSLAYMSRAPGDDVKAYDGTGDWFKIFEEGVCNQGADFTTSAWCSYGKDTLTATIPADTPDGEYLLRVEHIGKIDSIQLSLSLSFHILTSHPGVHRSHVNQPEHYVSCVQVKVTNGGSGNPGPTVTFPGAYKDTDEYANFNIYNGYKDFPMPGPAVWSSGGEGGDGGDGGGAQPIVSSEPTPAPTSTEAPGSTPSCWAHNV